MKALVFVLGLISAFALCPASYASPLTFYVTNGTFQSGGTFSGTYTINPVNDMITGGQFTVTDLGQTFTADWIHSFPYGPPGPDTQGLFSGIGGILYFDTSNSLTAPVLCTSANYIPCGGGDLTFLAYGNPFDFNADGATSADISPTPEPSSLILLATGILGVAAAARLRLQCTRQIRAMNT